LSDFEVGSK